LSCCCCCCCCYGQNTFSWL